MGVAAACAMGCVVAWFVALTFYDVTERRLPNVLTLPGGLLILVAAAVAGRGAPALIGAACLVGLYLVVHVIAPSGMGAGDVKLAVGIGALTGAFGAGVWMLAALAAPVFTAGWATVAARAHATVPHGPSMCLAAAVATGLAIL